MRLSIKTVATCANGGLVKEVDFDSFVEIINLHITK
jgi:hypothetical protein